MLLCLSDVRRLLCCKRSVLADEIYVGINVLAYYTQMGELVKQLSDQFGFIKVVKLHPCEGLKPTQGRKKLVHLLPSGQGAE